ncbi:MAG TPA: hypothetical protein VMG12_31385 [Polyangiaceae bacterium]|nr:hypothetical protein [Polyangiaceae bacterium]
MRFVLGCLAACLALSACSTESKKPDPLTLHAGKIDLPQVYPPVRDVTPAQLIADEQSAGGVTNERLAGATALGRARQKQVAINLATAVQERFYSMGPTDLLRIIKALDDRVLGLDTNPATHPCLTATPVPWTYTLPAGQTFSVKLQCLQEFGAPGSAGAGWVAFGFDSAASPDGGPVAAADGNDFYIVEGQETGNGGAYHLSGATGSVHGWLAVAERDVPLNSQVVLELLTDEPAATLELALAGSAVGFCGAHLKASADHLFVQGRTNAPPPPGSPMAGQYCDTRRAACYATAALGTDLGEGSPECAAVGPAAFAIGTELDASTDTGANVTPAQIWRYFSQRPTGVAAF